MSEPTETITLPESVVRGLLAALGPHTCPEGHFPAPAGVRVEGPFSASYPLGCSGPAGPPGPHCGNEPVPAGRGLETSLVALADAHKRLALACDGLEATLAPVLRPEGPDGGAGDQKCSTPRALASPLAEQVLSEAAFFAFLADRLAALTARIDLARGR